MVGHEPQAACAQPLALADQPPVAPTLAIR